MGRRCPTRQVDPGVGPAQQGKSCLPPAGEGPEAGPVPGTLNLESHHPKLTEIWGQAMFSGPGKLGCGGGGLSQDREPPSPLRT